MSVYKGKLGNKKETIYRHSTTFYRKLKALKANGIINSTVNQHFSIVKPLQNNLHIKAFPSTGQVKESTITPVSYSQIDEINSNPQ
jgi:Fe2+ or Zn2+ uptake regulation protein